MPQRRSRRAAVEDLWTKTVRDADGNTQAVPSARAGRGMRWRARYVGERSREHTQAFTRKVAAQLWLDKQTAAIVSGTHVAPRDAQLTVEQWCDLWIEGYKINRESTVRQARTRIRQIVEEFGGMPLSAVRPSQVKAWTAKLAAGDMEASYVYALHSPLSQILSDAVHDGVLGRNPCSRRTSPPMGKAKVYVATTEQVWAIHDAVPDHLRVACCWARSPGCGSLKSPRCGCPTSISSGEWSTRNSSGPPIRSRHPAVIRRSPSRKIWRCCCRRRCRNTRPR